MPTYGTFIPCRTMTAAEIDTVASVKQLLEASLVRPKPIGSVKYWSRKPPAENA